MRSLDIIKGNFLFSQLDPDELKVMAGMTAVRVLSREELLFQEGEEAALEAAPVWEHDAESTKCTLCNAKFTLFFRRVRKTRII